MYVGWVRVWYVHIEAREELGYPAYTLESSSLIEPGDYQVPASILSLLPTTLEFQEHIITLGILYKSWGFELRSSYLHISHSFSLPHYLQPLEVHYKIITHTLKRHLGFMTLTSMYTFVNYHPERHIEYNLMPMFWSLLHHRLAVVLF